MKATIMLRTTPNWKLFPLCLLAHAGWALAQQPAPSQAPPTTPPQTQTQPAPRATTPAAPAQQHRPSDAPPQLERIEPGSDVPATNIPPKRGTQIKETRDGGQVTEVEVTTPGGSHYYMKPNTQPGNAQTNSIRAPQWKVGEFDLSGKRKATSESGTNTPTTADAPPPPPMPATPESEKK